MNFSKQTNSMSLKIRLAEYYQTALNLKDWKFVCHKGSDFIRFSNRDCFIDIEAKAHGGAIGYPRSLFYCKSFASLSDVLLPVFEAVGQGTFAEFATTMICKTHREAMQKSGFYSSRMHEVDGVSKVVPILVEALESEVSPFFNQVKTIQDLETLLCTLGLENHEILPGCGDVKRMAIKWLAGAPDAEFYAQSLKTKAESHDEKDDWPPGTQPACKTAAKVYARLLNLDRC